MVVKGVILATVFLDWPIAEGMLLMKSMCCSSVSLIKEAWI